MGRPILKIELDPQDRSELRRRVRSAKTSQRDGLRARIILLRAEGKKQRDVADELGVSHVIVSKWIRRFMEQGLAGLHDAPGRGRKCSLPPEKVERVLTKATQPPKGRIRWSTRSMGRAVGLSPASVGRIWNSNQIKPHLIKTFKVSNDPRFEEKFWDVIGLYLEPPQKALVFCCDEKSQCQALERTQPGLPLGMGHIRTKTHDYVRHGTTTLFAALNYLEGKIIKRTEARHTHVEWLRFLKQINRETSPDLDIHLLVDNYCTHKHEKVKAWLKKRPRFHVHFTPTSSSWLNLVERFFAEITQECIRDGSFESVPRLEKAIHAYIDERNQNPVPYRWVADGAALLKKINRARKKLNKLIYDSGR